MKNYDDGDEITNYNDDDEIGKKDKEKISRFIHLFLNMMLRGFDEMEMQKRLELVDLLGFTIQYGFEKTYSRMIDFDRRLQTLERNYTLEKNSKKK